jgi:hypothetical protein
MRKLNIVDCGGAVALASVSGLFFVWALEIIMRTSGTGRDWPATEAIGTWFAGFGTFAAVVASLFLARSSDRKEQSKDNLRARMTALRYVAPLMRVHSDLNFLKVWAHNYWSSDLEKDTTVVKRLEGLKLDVGLDDLVLLAPIEGDFAERLYLLAMQLEVCAGTALSLGGALSHAYGASDDKALDAFRTIVGPALDQLEEHTSNALKQIKPLLDTCSQFAFTSRQGA